MMKLKTNTSDSRWWFWLITPIFIVAAVLGWVPAYTIVIAISVVQVVFFLAQEKDLLAFPVQIRIVYLALALFGLWPQVRLPIYILLLLGTIMVTFFGRCMIALGLKVMPWNKERAMRLN
jgi:hypothetical protein